MTQRFMSFRIASQSKFATAPFVRNMTGSSDKCVSFNVTRTVGQSNTEPSISVPHWNMVRADNKKLLSPWHDVTIQPSQASRETMSSIVPMLNEDAARTPLSEYHEH